LPNILYILFIYPIELLISICYAFIFRILESPGLSIIGLSILVSTLILPLYLMTEKQQLAEKENQKLFKRMKDNINAVFKGDKRYMLLSTLYRQNNYHPIFALRSSLGLIIQIPFFIAAYHFLSHLELLEGQKFKIFNNLGAPDNLLWGLNLLPILMTLINIVSGYIYTKGLEKRDKIQVYGVALLFLLLLYNSPSGLVLYWTCNNIYNLLKNIILNVKNSEKMIKLGTLIFSFLIPIYLLFFNNSSIKIRLFIAGLFLITLFFIFYKKQIELFFKQRIDIKSTVLEKPFGTFILSLICSFLLIGLVIPSILISSNIDSFSYLKPFSSPLPFIGITILQSLGICIWFIGIYFLFNIKIRVLLTVFLTASLFIFLINNFLFPIYLGPMSPDLYIFNFREASIIYKTINIIAILFAVFIVIKFLLLKSKLLFSLVQIVFLVSLLFIGINYVIKTSTGFNNIAVNNNSYESFDNIYTFNENKNQNNILIIILDMFSSGYIPDIFKEKPELYNSFNGFTYYPNTVSYGYHTLTGLPAILGGYQYTPLNINNRKDELFWDKYDEAFQVLPLILAEQNFTVTCSHLSETSKLREQVPDINLIENNKIKYVKTLGKLTEYYLEDENIIIKPYDEILFTNLIRFSLLKVFPLVFHKIIYDNGNYLSINEKYKSSLDYETIDNYSALYYLSKLTKITNDDNNYASIIYNALPHRPSFLQVPDYMPKNGKIDRGDGKYSEDSYYHVSMASMLLIQRWFDYLKDNDVYDNTRIIIVSDHGNENSLWDRNSFNLDFKFPQYFFLDTFNALLMMKDFYSNFKLNTDYQFMTNADVPHLSTNGIALNLTNPFSKEELKIQKDNGAVLCAFDHEIFLSNIKTTGKIYSDNFLYVHSDIFNSKNWSVYEKK